MNLPRKSHQIFNGLNPLLPMLSGKKTKNLYVMMRNALFDGFSRIIREMSQNVKIYTS